MRRCFLFGLGALLAVAAPVAAAPPETVVPGRLTVAVSLPNPGLQVGAVAPDGSVTYARGLEIDMARRVARALGIREVRFVNVPFFANLLTAGPKPWDMAVSGITITEDRRRRVDFSRAYLDADQGVLVRRNLGAAPAGLAALATLKLCTVRNSTGLGVIRTAVRPATAPQLTGNAERMFGLLQSGRCDAAVYDAPVLGAEVADAPDRYGPLVGRVPTAERYGVVFPEGSVLRARVDPVVKRLVADGTLRRLSRVWISTDVRALPVLR